MKISNNFCGGNIEVISVTEDEVVVERELRDSEKNGSIGRFACRTPARGAKNGIRSDSPFPRTAAWDDSGRQSATI